MRKRNVETIMVIPDNVTTAAARFPHKRKPASDAGTFLGQTNRFSLQWTGRNEKANSLANTSRRRDGGLSFSFRRLSLFLSLPIRTALALIKSGTGKIRE